MDKQTTLIAVVLAVLLAATGGISYTNIIIRAVQLKKVKITNLMYYQLK